MSDADIPIIGTKTIKITHFMVGLTKGDIDYLKFKIGKHGKLEYNGNFADFAKPDSATDESTSVAIFVERDANGTETAWFEYQAEDPRQNLNNGDWPQGTISEINASYHGTQGNGNA